MGNLYDKNNAPYLIAGAFATLVLLASGTLAVVPYIAFLFPVAAFNVALPVALSLSILSILVLALSCKMISNNKKIEIERNKFAEKEQELESVKQQLESKVQELENEITLGKEAGEAANEQEEQLNELTQEKQGLEKEVVELKAKVKGQLKHREEMLSFEHQELRDENTRLKEEKGNLQGELCKTKDKLSNLEHEYDDLYGVCSLDSQHTALEEKAGQLELVLQEKIKKIGRLSVQLREKEEEISSLKGSLEDSKEREKELSKKAKRLKERLDSKTQEAEKLAAEKEELFGQLQKEELNRNEIKSLNEQLNGAQQTLAENEQVFERKREDFCSQLEGIKNSYNKGVDKLNKQVEEDLKNKEIYVLSVVRKRVEQELFNSAEQQCMQDTDSIQEAVDKFMQPIYEKLGINNQLDISSEHSSEFKGTGENKSANEQFSKPKPPYIFTPTRSPYTKLNDASCDSGYFSGCSTSTNSYHTF